MLVSGGVKAPPDKPRSGLRSRASSEADCECPLYEGSRALYHKYVRMGFTKGETYVRNYQR